MEQATWRTMFLTCQSYSTRFTFKAVEKLKIRNSIRNLCDVCIKQANHTNYRHEQKGIERNLNTGCNINKDDSDLSFQIYTGTYE